MEVAASHLKTVLHSTRADIYYLERCRVLVKGGRVEYVTEQGQRSLYWNIPIANTTVVLLGGGTSVTQAAVRELAKAGVLIGFCGGGGTPLFASNETEIDVAWFSPQSEYRPTEYLQQWVRFWFREPLRLQAARSFQRTRLDKVRSGWRAISKAAGNECWNPDLAALDGLLDTSRSAIEAAAEHSALLTEEARVSKQLYRLAANATRYGDFRRGKRGESADAANRFLDHGNYLAYGLGATATWVLGIPHGLAVLHGKTRRGGLVFDVADLIKDATVLPQAFISAMRGDTEQDFRQACIEALTRTEALDFMIETIKEIAVAFDRLAQQTP